MRLVFNVIVFVVVVAAGAAAVGAVRVRIEPRQPLIDERPHGLLEGLRRQRLRPGQVEIALGRRAETGYTPHELPREVGEVAVGQGVAVPPPGTADLALVHAL